MQSWLGSWALFGIALSAVACGGTLGSDEIGEMEPISDEPSADSPVPETEETESVRASPATFHVAGKLKTALSPQARETVCFSYTEDLRVLSIDEYACTAAGDVDLCGGCQMHFVPLASGDGWLLAAKPGSPTCVELAGTYSIESSRICELAPPSTLERCGDGICPPERPLCVLHILGYEVCVSE